MTHINLSIHGQGISPSLHQIIEEFNDSLNKKPNVDVPPLEEGIVRIPFTFKIQGQSDDATLKRFVRKIKALLGKEMEIMHYSVSMKGKSLGNQVIHFTVTVDGQGPDSSVRKLVENVNAILEEEEDKMTHINLSIQGQGISPSLHQIIEEFNDSLNKKPNVDAPPLEEGIPRIPFTFKIQGQSDDATLKRFVRKIKALLGKEMEIMDYSVSMKVKSLGNQVIPFTVTVDGKGPDSSVRKLVENVNAILEEEEDKMTHINLSIQGQGISPSLHQIIEEFNDSLNKSLMLMFLHSKKESRGSRLPLKYKAKVMMLL
ncbi:Hypothetical predicted protein [Podarcis lilfordi]|uniref:Uncharacterized protein n=1 Tax=Podarcis lilfordi TaxID=74358 RepID=A0AA35P3D4_9SAUR|nr:Hypothetical predicted protein [Podarcis lilfordi]